MSYKKNRGQITNTRLINEETAIEAIGLCGVCVECAECEIGKRSKTGRTLFPEPFGVAQFSGGKYIHYLNEINIIPELWGDNFFFRDVDTKTILGGFKSSIPVSVAAMGSTKVAYNVNKLVIKGTAEFGIPYVLGENIWNTYGKEAIKERVELYKEHQKNGFGGFLIQGNYLETKQGIYDLAKELDVDGIEIKIGQGAKQGLGGEIKFYEQSEAEKYRKLGYYVIEREINGEKHYERHVPPGELKENTIEEILTKTDFDIVWVKTGIGKGLIKLIEQLNELNERYNNIKALTIDGYYGGTGMSPYLIMNETSVPSLVILKILEEKGIKPSFDIILAGGYTHGLDIAKALLKGAQGVAMGRTFNIVARTGVVNYLEGLKEELQMVSTVLKRKELREIIGKKEYLAATTKEASEFYGIPHIGKIEL